MNCIVKNTIINTLCVVGFLVVLIIVLTALFVLCHFLPITGFTLVGIFVLLSIIYFCYEYAQLQCRTDDERELPDNTKMEV